MSVHRKKQKNVKKKEMIPLLCLSAENGVGISER